MSAMGFRGKPKPLLSSFESFFAPELLTGDEMYVCETCNKKRKAEQSTKYTLNGTENGAANGKVVHKSNKESIAAESEPVRTKAIKRYSIKRAPQVLVLQLKRFTQTTFLRNGLQKAGGFVEFPLKLSIQEYCDESVEHAECPYTLMAIVVHGGTLYGGHYTAYVREACDPHFLGEWYYCNDSHITRVTEKDALAAEAYMLFYELRR
mmetsp:Transcript_4199/g.7374  ORF Transcript_4199/g.7374 Transcript_4199/m.7374 type:complete len:207 (-) Transcript_4199:350-970(-)